MTEKRSLDTHILMLLDREPVTVENIAYILDDDGFCQKDIYTRLSYLIEQSYVKDLKTNIIQELVNRILLNNRTNILTLEKETYLTLTTKGYSRQHPFWIRKQ